MATCVAEFASSCSRKRDVVIRCPFCLQALVIPGLALDGNEVQRQIETAMQEGDMDGEDIEEGVFDLQAEEENQRREDVIEQKEDHQEERRRDRARRQREQVWKP
jgi:TATA-binding protein-associated factor Taf7